MIGKFWCVVMPHSVDFVCWTKFSNKKKFRPAKICGVGGGQVPSCHDVTGQHFIVLQGAAK